jgi:hypothetical protein
VPHDSTTARAMATELLRASEPASAADATYVHVW